MGLLDKAKKLAAQAKDRAEDAVTEMKARQASQEEGSAGSGSHDPRFGTPYAPGMLGRPGWREQGLVDPAAVLPIADRERAGIHRSTKSIILEQPFGMGRRWTAGDRSAGLYYRLHADHSAWQPLEPTSPLPGVDVAAAAQLEDGRTVVLLGPAVVLETSGLDEGTVADLTRAVQAQLGP